MADDDLYGDLDTSADKLKITGLEAELATSERLRWDLEQRLATVQQREKMLQEENEQLAKNISCLFNTAKAELARKQKWIDQLRQQQLVDANIIKARQGGGGDDGASG